LELVYLWVEGYKNIEREGFNFSPRFECEFKDEKLTIKEKNKDDYLENFFGEDINVTAIVGENGSGKSSLLEMLFVAEKSDKENKNKYILFFKNNMTIEYYTSYANVVKISNTQGLKIKKIEEIVKKNKIHSIYISGLLQNSYNKLIRTKILNTNNNFSENMSYDATIIIKSLQLFQAHENILLKEKNITFNKFKMTMKSIEFNENIDEEIQNKYKEFIQSTSSNIEHKIIQNLLIALINIYYNKPEWDNFVKVFESNYSETNFDFISPYINPSDEILALIKLANEFSKKIIKYEFKEIINGTIVEYECIFNIKKHQHFVKDFLKEYFIFIEKYQKEYSEFQMLSIDLLSEKDLSLSSFSEGEKNIYSKIIELKYEFLSKEDNYIFLLDEPDNSLHPNWAKEFISILLNNIDMSCKHIHFIITSHSPFILSDIPKENVIFLKDGKQVDVDINSFGANIHTLLSHGFFMEDGLMGEFAKGKIEELINYLNDKESEIKTNEEAQKLLNIIGEPIIKNQLQRMLDSKRLSKIDEIDKLSKEMELMKHRIEFLRKR